MTDVPEPLIFPIAHYVGETYNSEDQTTTYDLRGGWRTAQLTQTERDVWLLAHGLPDRLQEAQRWTRTALLDMSTLHLGREAERVVADLLERDVLAEVVPGTEGAIDFAKEHRLVPLQLGLGNTREEPWAWRIGLASPVIAVSHTVYNTWEWCHLYRSLWDSCKSLVKIRREDSALSSKPEDLDPEVVLTEVLETAHALLSTSCAYFDVSFEWGTA
ncbi:MAG: hypothetical protein HKP61_16945 [Dactylosporangium sp.]|nr:hypothetical protein [Dactylosporangium sp.]NNJ62595.1 hypothetical protein [Dactylosporangium sp.]